MKDKEVEDKVLMTVRVPKSVHKALKYIAIDEERTLNWLIQKAAAKYVEWYHEEKK